MSLWDPVLDGPSKHETFAQRLVREIYQVGGRTRFAVEAELRAMVRDGRLDAAMEEASTSSLAPAVSLRAIATEQARLGDVACAVATARNVEEPDARAGIMVEIASIRSRASDPVTAEAALTEATAAAGKIRGKGWRHWRARRYAEIGLAKFRLGQQEAAGDACRLALKVAQGQRNATRDQTLADVVRAACLAEDTATAAAAIQFIGPGGYRDRSVGKLAGGLVIAGRVDEGLELLENLNPAVRFECLLWTGRMLTRPIHTARAEDLRHRLPELDYLGILVGQGTALQDLGRYAEAAEKQRAALKALRKLKAAGVRPHKQSLADNIAKDLALNLARIANYESASAVVGEIINPSERRCTMTSICVGAAEAGDLATVRKMSSRLGSLEDTAKALAMSAAAFVSSATTPREEGVISEVVRELAARRTSEALIDEAIQLTRQVPAEVTRDALLWMIVGASTKVGLIDAALAAALLIKDSATSDYAMRVIDDLPTPCLEQNRADSRTLT